MEVTKLAFSVSWRYKLNLILYLASVCHRTIAKGWLLSNFFLLNLNCQMQLQQLQCGKITTLSFENQDFFLFWYFSIAKWVKSLNSDVKWVCKCANKVRLWRTKCFIQNVLPSRAKNFWWYSTTSNYFSLEKLTRVPKNYELNFHFHQQIL